MQSLLKQKQGWIKIIEAFIAVLLITGALLIVINKGYIGGKDISEKVYEAQKAILREIELDDDLRAEVLDAEIKEVSNMNAKGVYDLIEKRKPDYLECEAVICELDVICALDIPEEAEDKDIYAQAVAIVAIAGKYEPRQLKLFCWRL